MLGTRRANLPMTDEVISQIHVNFVAASQLWPRVKCGRADLRILWTLNDHKPNTDHNFFFLFSCTANSAAMGNLRNAKCESAKGYFAKRRAKRSVIGRSGNAYFADYPSLLW